MKQLIDIVTLLFTRAAPTTGMSTTESFIRMCLPWDPTFDPTMGILTLTSFAAIVLVVERFIYFGKRRTNAEKYFEKVKETFTTGGIPEVLALVKNHDVPFAHVVRVAFENYTLPDDMIAEMMESEILKQRVQMERFLAGINTIGNVGPLMGLLGTVVGLIQAFLNIAVSGSGGPAVVAAGVGVALYTTEFGLVIAIPTIFFYNYFAKKSTDIVDELETFLRKLMKLISLSKGGSYENPKA